MSHQPAILAPVPPHAVFLFLDVRHGVQPAVALGELGDHDVPEHVLLGLGTGLVAALGAEIPGLRPLPALEGAAITMPSTPTHLMVRVAGDDPGQVLHRERALLDHLSSWEVTERVVGFMYSQSRDLTGYEDGTENPTGDDAVSVAISSDQGPGLDGSSVVAVQRWIHDLDTFQSWSKQRQDHTIGRERESNEELDEAPETAHVKRTAQEDFDPEAFVVRRSMPWRDQRGAGLVFVAFGATLDPFEALCRRMVGLDDGQVDRLFDFTRPVTGGTWWCPPLREGRLDLRALEG